MLVNLFKTAWRSLRRRPGLTCLNVFGLGVSLGVALLVLFFVRDQWQIDRFHPRSEQIHRVIALNANGSTYASSPAPLADALRTADVPGIEAVVQFDRIGTTFIARGDSSLAVKAIRTDGEFWDVFSGFELQAGDRASALNTPGTAVLTAETADAFFGAHNPMGKTVRLDGETELTVTGVLAPPAGPTQLDFDVFVASRPSDARADPEAWERRYSTTTFVRLTKGTSTDVLTAAATSLFEAQAHPETLADFSLRAESLDEARFGPARNNDMSPRMRLPAWIFGILLVLASVGLIAAAFNYVNLSVAQSLQRKKEIGVRKTLGSGRGPLIGQFLGEAVLTTLGAGGVAVLLFSALAPSFNSLFIFNLMGVDAVRASVLFDPGALALIFVVCVGVGLLAGVYPAFVLSSFRPVRVLGGDDQRRGTNRVRTLLIGLQVAFTVVLLVTAATLLRQTRYIASADHTLQTERLISVNLEDVDFDRFRRAVRSLSSVEDVTAINNLMLGPSNYNSVSVRSERVADPVSTTYYAVDSSYVRTMGLTVVASTPAWASRLAAGDGVVVNRAAAQRYGFDASEKILGTTLTLGDPSFSTSTKTVVGVVENFEYSGIAEMYTPASKDADAPLMLRGERQWVDYALVRARHDDLASVRVELEDVWTAQLPTDQPFEARFYADVLRMRYGPLQDASWMTTGVAGLAIVIALMGLFSLAAHHVQTRRKEIGVRKALGASAQSVAATLSKGFLGLVVGASLLSAPLGWLLNRWWLNFFDDAVTVNVGIVTACVLALVALSLVTIGTQTWSAAQLDPARTLRDE